MFGSGGFSINSGPFRCARHSQTPTVFSIFFHACTFYFVPEAQETWACCATNRAGPFLSRPWTTRIPTFSRSLYGRWPPFANLKVFRRYWIECTKRSRKTVRVFPLFSKGGHG